MVTWRVFEGENPPVWSAHEAPEGKLICSVSAFGGYD